MVGSDDLLTETFLQEVLDAVVSSSCLQSRNPRQEDFLNGSVAHVLNCWPVVPVQLASDGTSPAPAPSVSWRTTSPTKYMPPKSATM